jgi:hypothetical protein
MYGSERDEAIVVSIDEQNRCDILLAKGRTKTLLIELSILKYIL